MQAIKYLSRCLYRGVISKKNIIKENGQHVTYRYLDSKTLESKTEGWKTRTVTGEHILWLIYQHVLPIDFRHGRGSGFFVWQCQKALQRN
ncbi:MAG: transposase [Pseudomonadales bacterium]|nr:transposase [Pseudomonadales bacterium]